MAIAWESAASDFVTADADTAMAVTKPTGLAAGELMVAFGGCVDSRSLAPPSGWTERANDSNGVYRVQVWTRTADAGDAAATDFAFTASGTFSSAAVAVHRVSGAGAAAPTTGFATGANSQTQTCPTLVGLAAGCLVFWGGYTGGNHSSTADKGTERVDVGNAAPGLWLAQYTAVEATGGSVAGAVITTTGFGSKRVYSVAVEAAGGGGGGAGGEGLVVMAQQAFHMAG